jgi:hypothetical protein
MRGASDATGRDLRELNWIGLNWGSVLESALGVAVVSLLHAAAHVRAVPLCAISGEGGEGERGQSFCQRGRRTGVSAPVKESWNAVVMDACVRDDRDG